MYVCCCHEESLLPVAYQCNAEVVSILNGLVFFLINAIIISDTNYYCHLYYYFILLYY